jgi:hypothetical protein
VSQLSVRVDVKVPNKDWFRNLFYSFFVFLCRDVVNMFMVCG